MKVLVITDVLWRNDNGVGNTYSNMFDGIDDIEFANICCQTGVSKNVVSTKCFQMSETQIIKNFINSTCPVGIVEEKAEETAQQQKDGKFLSFIKKSRLQIFFDIREAIWKIGSWKNERLNSFLDEFNPDIIFAQIQDKIYLNNIISYVKDYTNKPLFLYTWDDNYSLKQFFFSPLYWINRLAQRRSIRKIVKKCEILYTISEEQRVEYAKLLGANTKLLYKGKKFTKKPYYEKNHDEINLLYAGNLYSGRYKTIKKVCDEIALLNEENVQNPIFLNIYSGTALSKKEVERLNTKWTHFCGRTSEEQVQELETRADALLHVEPFSKRGRLICRLSFSTKLVDYFYKGKGIIAIGSRVCSSMKYLKRHDAALVCTQFDSIKKVLSLIKSKPDCIADYADKAWECGYKNHQIDDIQNMLRQDFIKSLRG